MRKRVVFFVIAVMLSGTALAQTAVYKWVDKSGQVHYSSVPPSTSLAPTSIVNTAADQQAASAASAPSAASATRAADRALTIPEPADTAACKSARAALSKYLGASYLYTVGKDGAHQKLSSAQEAQALAEASKAVTTNCSPTGLQS